MDANHGAENPSHGKKRKVPNYAAYCELVWGMKTRGYVALAKKLDRPKQDLIMAAGVLTIDMSLIDDEDAGEEATDAANDPCAFLEIWYVLFCSFAKN